MSKYKAYGKGRGNSRAGLQFDRLIKACSNSKKPPTAMAAGALGRFGVAQFTSTRSCLDSTGEDEQMVEKPSRFSSLHKRPRIEPLHPPNLEAVDPFLAAHYPIHSAPPPLTPQIQQTVMKPRKFFKSRGPMEVEVDQIRPLRPDVSNLVPQHYPTTNTNPILGSNQSNISLNSRHSSVKVSPKKRAVKEPPTSFNSPPIKLKIIKDKVTSKFVSVAEADTLPSPLKANESGRNKGKKEKKVKEAKLKSPPAAGRPGRGRPPKNRDAAAPTTAKSYKEEVAPKVQPAPTPPNPKRTSGRVTRASARFTDNDQEDHPDQNQNQAPSSAEETEYYNSEMHTVGVEVPVNSQETIRKLEEDSEFQKLSQILSSMEEEPAQNETFNSSFESNYSGGEGSNTMYSTNSNYQRAPLPPQQQQQHQTTKDEGPQDIRAILEDDWNVTFEEESPRKSQSQVQNCSQSPPKVSRFDPSAFMSETSSPEENSKIISPPHQPPPVTTPAQEIQRPIPLYPTFNINSSPYSMKNLLGGSGKEQNCGEIVPESQSQPSQDDVDSKMDVSIDSGTAGSQESTADSQILFQNSQPSSQSSFLDSSQPQKSQVQPKKASIFKSRSAKANKPTKAVYKHTFGQVDKAGEEPKPAVLPPGSALFEDFEDYGDEKDADLNLRKMRIGDGGTSNTMDSDDSNGSGSNGSGPSKVLCKKKAKKLFTVVRNVKAGHELQESGEFHEFDGDIWYILEDLKDKNPMNSRCLSAVTLAGRCMDQAFRMHLRAHGTVSEFCKELHDAPQHPVLSLLAATVLFVLSQDRLNMDLDTESLKLILALTKADFEENNQAFTENAETMKNRQRVIQLCSEMKNRGHAKHLKLEKLTASELALETLLYLTSKRAGEWVKHELRTLGGLNSIVGEVDSSFKFVKEEIQAGNWNEVVMERLRKIDRCLEVLGQVTFNHEDNQRYLMQVSSRDVEGGGPEKCTSVSPTVFLDMFQFCKEFLVKNDVNLNAEQNTRIREILFLVLRLLVNLSHDYRGIVLGSEIIMGIDGFLELSLHSIFEMTKHFPDEKVFDLLMHSLCLLLNLVEISRKNRYRLLQTTIRKNSSGTFSVGSGVGSESFNDSDDSGMEDELPLLDALICMFLQRERSAKKEEQHTDNILTTGEKDKNSQGASSQKDSQEEGSSLQDTIDKLIQTAGKHMENSLIAAYISLLIAFLVMDDMPYVEKVREMMPTKNFLPLMVVLKKLFNFMSITSSASGSTRGLKATAIALKFYGKVDTASAEELKKIIPE